MLGLPLNPGCINRNHTHGTHAPVEEPSTASIADMSGNGVRQNRKAASWRPFQNPISGAIHPGQTERPLHAPEGEVRLLFCRARCYLQRLVGNFKGKDLFFSLCKSFLMFFIGR
jgi:hypothetical protein